MSKDINGACVFIATILVAAFLSSPALAKVSGPCSNCHTMHNSQDGERVTAPGWINRNALTAKDCLGCHSATDPGTAFDPVTNAPIVYNTGGAPTYGAGSMGLAGGNFYFVENDGDNRGHNVIETNPDDTLASAPTPSTYCSTAGSCHVNLWEPIGLSGIPHRQGCTKCHMLEGSVHGPWDDPIHSYPVGYHHRDDSDLVIDTLEEGWYRYLSGHQSGRWRGVTGIEDDDYEYTYSASDHNEYMAPAYGGRMRYRGGLFTAENTMTGFCTGCHKDFHITIPLTLQKPYFRHPASDSAIPNTGEYANAYGAAGSGSGIYDPVVPVARPLANLTGVSAVVNIGQDKPMCLTCHKAHGSPYPDMLRFDYDAIIAGGGTSNAGCFKCHTKKDDGS